jgi:hypothetical protein
MLRRGRIKGKKLYQIKYPANNDLLTFLEFLKTEKFVNLSEKLLYYRVHGRNDSMVGAKQKFFNTLKIRFWAVQKLHIKPSLKAIFLNLIQLIVITLLPEKLIFTIYMLAKGIYSPKDLVYKLSRKISVSLKLHAYSFSKS